MMLNQNLSHGPTCENMFVLDTDSSLSKPFYNYVIYLPEVCKLLRILGKLLKHLSKTKMWVLFTFVIMW